MAPCHGGRSVLVRDKSGHINEQASLSQIESFLRLHPAAQKNTDGNYERDAKGNFVMRDYVKHYTKAYKSYADRQNYSQNRKRMIENGYIQSR